MIISFEEHDNILIVRTIGQLDIYSRDDLEKAIRDKVKKNGIRKIMIDVGKLKRIDSAGIGCLVTLLNMIRSRLGDLRIAGPFLPSVEESFNLCGLDKVFIIYPDSDTGMKELLS